MTPHPSAESGKREERDIVHQFRAIPGWDARRVPSSGACIGYKGDVIITSPDGHEFRLESKVRQESAGQGIKTLTGWLGRNDILWMRFKGHHKPVIVIPWDVFFEIVEHWQGGVTMDPGWATMKEEIKESRP